MRCPNCARENRDVARFCQYCGASFAAPATTTPAPREIETAAPAETAEPAPLSIESAGTPETQESTWQPEPGEQPSALGPLDPDTTKEPDQATAAEPPFTHLVFEDESASDPEAGAGAFAEDDSVDAPVTWVAALAEDKSVSTPETEAGAFVEDESASTLETESGVFAKQAKATGTVTAPEEPDTSSSVPDADAPAPDGALPQAADETSWDPDEDVKDEALGAEAAQDRPDADADLDEGWQESDGQEIESVPALVAELEPIPPEDTRLDTSLEPEEIGDLDEPLAEMQDLVSAGLLPWRESVEPDPIPFLPLEPGSIVDGRYQVIEVAQVEKEEARYSVRDLERCPRCGSTDNSPNEAFCASCGALMEQKPVATMLERAAPGDVEPDNAEAADSFGYGGHHYWVWQEMEQKTRDEQLPLRMIAAQLSDKGQVRELDEDSLFVLTTSSIYESTPHRLGLFVVADGMGGHAGGEVASRIAIQRLVQSLLNNVFAPALTGSPLAEAVLLEHLESAVHAANDRVYLERQKRGNDMGTTLTVALLVDWTLYLAHVGDCRAYRWGQDGLQQLTIDHSIVAGMVAAGTIEPEEVYTHPQRSVIYRSIGDHPAVEVDLGTVELTPDDRLVLCCDGLWEMIRSEGIEDVLLREADPHTACEIMVDQANRAGGTDNISVIIVQF